MHTTTMVYVQGADRMIIRAQIVGDGVMISFADGRQGLIPFSALHLDSDVVDRITLPNPFEVVLELKDGKREVVPWDFARHFADTTYQERMKRLGQEGLALFGKRLKKLRQDRNMSQEELARLSGVSRVTIARIETAQQSPMYETLTFLAQGLAVPLKALLTETLDSEQ